MAAAAVSLGAWVGLQLLSPAQSLAWSGEMREAAARMDAALEVVRRHHETAGIPIDPRVDPNRTGLVGPAYTELFTTLGNLEAKRTTTSPDMAALLVHLLDRAGVGRGDTVAVGASGSFPGLLVATLVAAEALGAHPVAVLSLGSSSYGATRPGFDLLALHRLLVEEGVVESPPAAASLGGAGDAGADLDPETRRRLLGRITGEGVALVHEADLAGAVGRRMAVYGEGVAAFVNIGGADAVVGVDPSILGVAPGLVEALPPPRPGQGGVLHAMAARDVPVIHLLDIRSLALRHGLPWDPVPLPGPGATLLRRDAPPRDGLLVAISGVWLTGLVIIFTKYIIIVGSGRPEDSRGRPHPDPPDNDRTLA